MDFQIQTIAGFTIAGITLRTTNQDNRALREIGQLWGKWFAEKVSDQIPHKVDETVYSLYYDYESDYQGEYTVLLGCKVTSVEGLPAGLTFREVPEDRYAVYHRQGTLPTITHEIWTAVYSEKAYVRGYRTDFDRYPMEWEAEDRAKVEVYVSLD